MLDKVQMLCQEPFSVSRVGEEQAQQHTLRMQATPSFGENGASRAKEDAGKSKHVALLPLSASLRPQPPKQRARVLIPPERLLRQKYSSYPSNSWYNDRTSAIQWTVAKQTEPINDLGESIVIGRGLRADSSTIPFLLTRQRVDNRSGNMSFVPYETKSHSTGRFFR